jgi:hypothetical protein
VRAGAGATGEHLYAHMACELGARTVYDENPQEYAARRLRQDGVRVFFVPNGCGTNRARHVIVCLAAGIRDRFGVFD